MFGDELTEHQASTSTVKNAVKLIAINLLLILFLNPYNFSSCCFQHSFRMQYFFPPLFKVLELVGSLDINIYIYIYIYIYMHLQRFFL